MPRRLLEIGDLQEHGFDELVDADSNRRRSHPTRSAMNERFDLSGRIVIITGGGKGIGKVYSEEFAKAGARVVAADIDGAAAKSVADALCAQGLNAVGLAVDIASEESAAAMAKAALERFGAIDALIN